MDRSDNLIKLDLMSLPLKRLQQYNKVKEDREYAI